MTWTLIPLSLPVLAILSYAIGSIPFGLIFTSLGGGGDIRRVGSGNIGATNVLRTGRKGLAAATLLFDALKGALAVLIAQRFSETGTKTAMAVAAVSVVVGHCFPIWLRFRGGKGVATGLGTIGVLCWPAGLLCCMIWLAVARLSRISSVGALAAFLAAPALVPPLSGQTVASPLPIATAVIGVLIWVRHYGNIARLMSGREPRVGLDAPPQRRIDV